MTEKHVSEDLKQIKNMFEELPASKTLKDEEKKPKKVQMTADKKKRETDNIERILKTELLQRLGFDVTYHETSSNRVDTYKPIEKIRKIIYEKNEKKDEKLFIDREQIIKELDGNDCLLKKKEPGDKITHLNTRKIDTIIDNKMVDLLIENKCEIDLKERNNTKQKKQNSKDKKTIEKKIIKSLTCPMFPDLKYERKKAFEWYNLYQTDKEGIFYQQSLQNNTGLNNHQKDENNDEKDENNDENIEMDHLP